MKRKRILRNVERVTSSPVDAIKLHTSGQSKPALHRHKGIAFDDFKGVKTPKNVGYAILCDIAAIVQTFRKSRLFGESFTKVVTGPAKKSYESGLRPLSMPK